MALTIYAEDSQFAVATGRNVNSGRGTSSFDYPPTASHDLVITSQPGDDSPYVFSPGDTYTVSFSGEKAVVLENARVVRSDAVNYGGDRGYAVVFEGTDGDGALVQVVWTPEFDFETWYWNAYRPGAPPGFYNTDQSAATTYQAVCFEASMRIATPSGSRAAGALQPGDAVRTLDHGPQPLRRIATRRMEGRGRHAPVTVAPGALGNTDALVLSQQHRILLQGPEVRRLHGVAQVLVPAVAFVDGRAIRVTPRPDITYVHLLFDRHELLCCHGVLCESLYPGPVARQALAATARTGAADRDLDDSLAGAAARPARAFLTAREGHELIGRIAGRRPRRPAFLLTPGRRHACAYRLDPARMRGRVPPGHLPACRMLRETEP
ncbi:Hint domain-containing protein [Celeribacter indicus]|uniref:Type I secretion target repeat-containing protein n=1 Tax=Celeribacter indicus TaxID=1208324 RepID=A0A0B5E4F5_9RHOB|nr:Hint domain-containing protein [Celeribacter indicus]AJE47936.1 type I secretion target repeat-containing protein [Celeribacter indicus]SDW27358.1 Hint domain-containing protein [Celeribacter indicus]